MPATTVDKSASSKTSSRFELPALKLDFGNITDGTNIPPPPKSPAQKPQPAAKPAKRPLESAITEKNGSAPVEANGNGLENKSQLNANGNLAGTKRPAEDGQPVLGRPGSLRRFFSRSKLNNAYAEGETSTNAVNGATYSRPPSRSGSSVLMDEKRSRRSSGWFSRLRSGDTGSRRSSMMLEHPSIVHQPAGPPPPMIPEMRELENDEGSLGNDLFKNIK